MADSRISGFHKLSIAERINELQQRGWLCAADAVALRQGRHVISAAVANSMIENVIGTFSLPLAVAPNFIVNGKATLVPLVVEEPSIVAALSYAAALAARNEGFTCRMQESLLIGQIHISAVADIERAQSALNAEKEALLVAANAVHPRLNKRGGGVKDIEFRSVSLPSGESALIAHVLVDTCDAMGANLVNTICEAIAPTIAKTSGGEVSMSILSNLADRSVVTASVRYRSRQLATENFSGVEIRDRIIRANDIAQVDTYRAATHNKGIMNGVDAVAIATGNDWRAIEAAAHAYAACGGRYEALTRWSVGDSGDLVGELRLPLKVATVGGTLGSNPAAQLGLALCGVESARELAMLMAAVGLAQNFSALRALVGSGIQDGHMRLHARSLAAAAGADASQLDAVVTALIDSGEIKDWKAREIVRSFRREKSFDERAASRAAGKVILLGEHAVVYGSRALAIPLRNAVRVTATACEGVSRVRVADWSLDERIDPGATTGVAAALHRITSMLGLEGRQFDIQVSSSLPRGVGLGSSAAIAVGLIRAIAVCSKQEISDARVNEIAFECEKLAHGTPSGIDNTVSCFAVPMLFRNIDAQLRFDKLSNTKPLPLLLAFSHSVAYTSDVVAAVRQRREEQPSNFDAIFAQIDALAESGAEALRDGNLDALGRLMNINHGLLNAIGVSTPELESMVSLARDAGAVGAKLTGAGGGGAIVALCGAKLEAVRSAFVRAGYGTLIINEIEELKS